MFKQEDYQFKWGDIGDIELGRENLGPLTNVAVYRLMQYTMRNTLVKNFGVERTNTLFFESGKLAGTEFCKNLLDITADLNTFIAELHDVLLSLKIGVLRIEKVDMENLHIILTVSEDLDCSGLPVTGETVCDYDEGFIAGILGVYTKKEFDVKEIDCWSTGDRTCRFEVKPKSPIVS